MNRWFNILPDGSYGCKILIYGYISTWEYDGVSSKSFVTELAQAEASYKEINVHINSNGGDVFEGLAIFNALRNSQSNINIYIDGVAASIASVIALCGKSVYMNRYSRMMIHSVTAGSYGNAQQMEEAAKMIRDIESILVSIFSDKTGLKDTDVKKKWFDGSDHWLTADEAIEAKLINGVFDGVKAETPPNPPQGGTAHAMKLFEIYNSLLTKNDSEMKNLFKKLGFQNEATEDDAIKKVDALESQIAQEKKKYDELAVENTNLKAKLKEKEDAEKALQSTEVENILKDAINTGKIQEPQKPHFKAILEKDFENGKAILASMQPARKLKDELNKLKDEKRDEWTFDDYHRKDPKALAEMKAKNPEGYKALFDARFGA